MSKIAIVTGGSRGIGHAISKALLQNGFTVCILGQRSEADCVKALSELRAHGTVAYYQGSIAEDADRRRLIDSIIGKYGRIDVLINNAGIAPNVRADILEMTEASYDRVVDTNLKGTMMLTQLAANAMLQQAQIEGSLRGVIVNISSFSAEVASINRGEYCISKAGLSMVTKLFAKRLAGDGILVYEIRPGIIETDMTAGVKEKYDNLLAGDAFTIHRWGQPEDVANAVLPLVRGELRYTTGQVINVDGGYMDVRSI